MLLCDVKVTFEGIAEKELASFEEKIKKVGEILEINVIDFGIYESYEVKELYEKD